MMPPPAARDVASGATRPLVVSSVLLTMTVLLIYVLIVFPRPFMFSSEDPVVKTSTAPSIPETSTVKEEDHYSLLNDTYSRHQIPLFNVPYLYRIRLKVYVPWKRDVDFGEKNWLTEGYSVMYFTVARTNTRCQVHFVGLHIVSIHIQDDFGRNITVKEVSRLYPHVLDVHTEHELIENMNYSLHIHYTSHVEVFEKPSEIGPRGLHSSFYDVGEETRQMVSTHCQTQDARTIFPCIDVPDAKAKFSATIIHPKGTSAVFNSKETGNFTDGNWTITTFGSSPLMSTYLFALAISEFAYKETKSDNIRIRVYAEQSRIEEADLAISIMPKIIKYLEGYFGIPCPLNKLDVYEVPTLRVRAMENWGLITAKAKALLYNPNTSTPADRINVQMLLAHEVTHQWFGNLVTMKWWNNLWLNEGFAIHLGNKVVRHLGVDEFDHYRAVAYTMRADHDKGIVVSCRELPTFPPDSVFAGAYYKPSYILKMVENIVGEEAFRMGVIRFLKRFSYSNADHVDLMEALSYAHDSSLGNHLSGQPFSLSDVIETWIYQIGIPVVILNTRDDGVVIASQQAYYHAHSQAVAQQQWKIPLFIRHPVTKEQKIEWLVENDTVAIDLGDDVVLDIETAAYTRIRYDDVMYSKIVRKLRLAAMEIPMKSRARLIDDTFTFAEHGDILYGTVFEILTYLPNETALPPFEMVHAHLDFLYSRLNVHPRFGELLDFVNALLSPIFVRFHENPPKDENNGEHSLQDIVCKRVCLAGFAPCVKMATTAVWKAHRDCGRDPFSGSCNSIQPHMRRCVYAAASMYGEQELWDVMYEKYLIEPKKSERENLWMGMVASTRKNDIDRALEDLLFLSRKHIINIKEHFGEYSKYYHVNDNFVRFIDANMEKLLETNSAEDFHYITLLYVRTLTEVEHIPQFERYLSVLGKKFPQLAKHDRAQGVRLRQVPMFRQYYAEQIFNNISSVLKSMQSSFSHS